MPPARFLVVAAMTLCIVSCGGSTQPPPLTFTISGTVSGLLGMGLTLQNNGGNNLAVSANGTFTFSAPSPSGAVYNVTVLSQPSNPPQNCSVTNGSGTVTGNVGNVQVTCATVTYTIGGTVSGLAGSGLVLQNNGGDNLAVQGNGSFMFASPIASGSNYNVSVSAQPLSPSQNCVVTNGSGTANANITSIQVTCTTTTFYTIGGSVSGLATNTNVLLLDNGSDLLPVNADGTFTFNTSVASGSTYSVTISRQPFDENCKVANGSGVANADVTSIQVTCASKLKVLYAFGPPPDGNNPAQRVVFDKAGNLYGVTLAGGTSSSLATKGSGIVFKLTPTATGPWTETVLYNFCQQANCADGDAPQGTLVVDTAGNLYGTTSQGGAYGGGVVFQLAAQPNGTWTYSVIHNFGNAGDGKLPQGGVIFDSAGNLYGTAGFGGGTPAIPCGGTCGTVYELSPGPNNQWDETILYTFCQQSSCTDGNGPVGELVFDAAGNLYGTTASGGVGSPTDVSGVVFELSPPSGSGQWTETVLHTFLIGVFSSGGYDGYGVTGGLTLTHSNGVLSLLGTTTFGGCCGNNGLLYDMQPILLGVTPPWDELRLYGFCSQLLCTDGSSPNGGLVVDSSGAVYGTTRSGGPVLAPAGVIFKALGGGPETTIYSFLGGTDGCLPSGGLTMDAAGNLYGVTLQCGDPTSGAGVVYEVTP